jgi:hypothetical protein
VNNFGGNNPNFNFMDLPSNLVDELKSRLRLVKERIMDMRSEDEQAAFITAFNARVIDRILTDRNLSEKDLLEKLVYGKNPKAVETI